MDHISNMIIEESKKVVNMEFTRDKVIEQKNLYNIEGYTPLHIHQTLQKLGKNSDTNGPNWENIRKSLIDIDKAKLVNKVTELNNRIKEHNQNFLNNFYTLQKESELTPLIPLSREEEADNELMDGWIEVCLFISSFIRSSYILKQMKDKEIKTRKQKKKARSFTYSKARCK